MVQPLKLRKPSDATSLYAVDPASREQPSPAVSRWSIPRLNDTDTAGLVCSPRLRAETMVDDPLVVGSGRDDARWLRTPLLALLGGRPSWQA